MSIENKIIVKQLKFALANSKHPDSEDDNIQPSLRKRYDGDKLGDKIEFLISILEDEL